MKTTFRLTPCGVFRCLCHGRNLPLAFFLVDPVWCCRFPRGSSCKWKTASLKQVKELQPVFCFLLATLTVVSLSSDQGHNSRNHFFFSFLSLFESSMRLVLKRKKCLLKLMLLAILDDKLLLYMDTL